ncbi:MAG: methylenetetrahydrofolate--tRNA-(uracil(54)-C(5))-methyltransferase (FADH(2)-oxidizing) TrmFO [Acidobacteria bacterium]|nr:methylenetetrahydrofolate--tRNA-(uracil(54)-C(5))-methyltransferase (FADH(2)-oxidizing) TrmFO [Acidobacteriota bacterium]MBI3656215.1 methylenetetrahydrofolate--tRNA-(uracil(54)-C(5))-methyltransferase (FADH(2)-oxidizing) TrmFO [Acidobacteriota bacterium]
MVNEVVVLGAGLAGSEAAWQLAQRGIPVVLYEMRPAVMTPAHQTGAMAELVCSNSLKSDEPGTAPNLLKEELRRLGSLLMSVADQYKVPAGSALAVDRERFSAEVTQRLRAHPLVTVVGQEAQRLPCEGLCIIATGPLTSPALTAAIADFTGHSHLYFYDAISPVVDAESIDFHRAFRAARYDKGGEDYVNCPMTPAEYDDFYQTLLAAESAPLHGFEKAMYFEGCLPIEELARRGRETLLFGPMKPVGLIDPHTNLRPYAVVQLRVENLMANAYNMVGFQNHLKFPEQKRVFRMIPGLENAEFFRLGQIHRNTYINSPRVLRPTLQTHKDERVFFSGQICGVEGYVECIATGLMAGINAARMRFGQPALIFPRQTACGSLTHYVTKADPNHFQPANINFALLPTLPVTESRQWRSKQERRREQVRRGLEALTAFQRDLGETTATRGA